MKQYQETLRYILENGIKKGDRTGTGTLSVFGTQSRYDLRDGFPLTTTKKTAFRIIFEELKWFMSGDTNLQTLLKKNVHIWDDDAYRAFLERVGLSKEEYTKETFLHDVLHNDQFAMVHGDLGRIYSKQWREWRRPDNEGTVDQLQNVIDSIKNNPDSRRHIITAWNPGEIEDMALPPCHALAQFYVTEGKLSLHLYQRSGDAFLGVPFNIASYALLLILIAKEVDLEPYELIHSMGDAHLYLNHIEQAKLQLTREPRPLPTLKIINDRENIWDYEWEDFELIGYDPYPAIKAKQSS